jgi:hypothetical protein
MERVSSAPSLAPCLILFEPIPSFYRVNLVTLALNRDACVYRFLW